MPKIKVYSTTTCPYCHMEKEYLKEKGIDFEDIIVDRDPAKATDLIDTCGTMAVPCTHVIKDDGTEEKIVGFDQDKLESVLGIKN